MKKKKVYKKIVAVTVGTAMLMDASVMNAFASDEQKELESSEIVSQEEVKESVVEKDVKANRTIYVGGLDTPGPSGSGTENDPYKYFEQAVHAAKDGDTILVVGITFLNRVQDEDGSALAYTIDKNITIAGISNEAEIICGRPIQLGADVTFKNLSLLSLFTGKENCIYTAGYHLTLDNVSTFRHGVYAPPYLFGGAYKNDSVGKHAQMTIKNPNSGTQFSGIYAGSKFKNYKGDVTINIDDKTKVGDEKHPLGIYAGGYKGDIGNTSYDYKVEGTVNINVTSTGVGSNIKAFTGTGATDINGKPSANLSLTGVNDQSFEAYGFNDITIDGSTIAPKHALSFVGSLGNFEIKNKTKLDLSKAWEFNVGGDFIGETDVNKAGILKLGKDKDDQELTMNIDGTVTGNTYFTTAGGMDNVYPPVSGPVVEGHTYITSSANAGGEFLFKPFDTVEQINMTLEKEQTNGKTQWTAKKTHHELKEIIINGPKLVTVDDVNDADIEEELGVFFGIKTIDTNDVLYAADIEYEILDSNGQNPLSFEVDYAWLDGEKLIHYVKLYPTYDGDVEPGNYKLVVKDKESGKTLEHNFKITDALTGTVEITGDAKVGNTLTAKVEGLPQGVSEQDLIYQWYADGALIEGANNSTLVAGKDLVGKTITVNVTTDIYAGKLISNGVVIEAKDITGAVTINGTAKVGETLTADATNLPADAKNVSYQWYANGLAIPGATSTSWDVKEAYVGQTITVQVVADNYTGSITSAGVVVQPADKEPTVTIEGKPVVGSTLTANLHDVPAGTHDITYQWYADGVAIPGATSDSWVIEEAYVGKTITVKATIGNLTIESLGMGVTRPEENSPNTDNNSPSTDSNTPNTGDSTNVFSLLLLAFGAMLTKIGILFKDSKEKE